jgi:hypothetical protein
MVTGCRQQDTGGVATAGLPLVPGLTVDEVKDLVEVPRCNDQIFDKAKGALADTLMQLHYVEVEKRIGALYAKNNETHDCQQVIVSNPGVPPQYGPLVTAWLLKRGAQGDFATAKPVAGIYADARVQFTALDIPANKSCILLRGENADTANWYAWIVPADPTTNCDLAKPTGDSINVWRTDQNTTGKDRHSVRIIDAQTDYFIGVACRDYWCVIGVPDEGAKPNALSQPLKVGSDYQRLSVLDRTTGKPTPTTLYGEIHPDTLTRPEPNDTNGYRVATIVFRSGTGTERDRQLYAEKFGVPLAALADDTLDVRLKPLTNGNYRFSYDGYPGREVVPLNVTSNGHSTVRWRWSGKDEGVWVACPRGCCGDDG